MSKNSETFNAKIAVEKSLLKEYRGESGERVVYMDDGKEFQIQLYNDQPEEIAIKVFINNKPTRHFLVLRPAERCWLERYTDRPVKFKFSVYNVDGSEKSKELISDNGVIKLQFFKKKEYRTPYYYDTWYDRGTRTLYSTGGYVKTTTTGTSIGEFYSSTTTCDSALNGLLDLSPLATTSSTKTIDTGRVGDGGTSSQTFSTTNMSFETFPYKTEVIKILPSSTKPVYAGDLQKLYCPECGRKLNSKYKFCPYCGTEVDSALLKE